MLIAAADSKLTTCAEGIQTYTAQGTTSMQQTCRYSAKLAHALRGHGLAHLPRRPWTLRHERHAMAGGRLRGVARGRAGPVDYKGWISLGLRLAGVGWTHGQCVCVCVACLAWSCLGLLKSG